MNESLIFAEALKRGTPAERAAFLDGACGNNESLRKQVEDLLRAGDRDDSFLEKPAGNLAATVDVPAGRWHDTNSISQPDDKAGTLIGPYKLLQKIGEGGMGTVWMAEQQEPVRRMVAVKLVKAGMDSDKVVARFEAERQALALMDHPNIARIYDAGITGNRPFFVMELVKGTPITQYCDEHRLSPNQRLELFVSTCAAIQHAHQKGIIHRDIKPSNVLVAPYDGRPVVKVIDFGVAKATGQRLTDKTMYTEFGAIVGTLEYMSPEQAELNNQDIDTRSDIYALGVLLYELLTGSTPLNRQSLKQQAMLEMLRMVREEEPPKPSTRLSTDDALPSISAQRQTDPAKLTRLMKGELDLIVMKSLDKDRNRRYETANGFAMDIQRYLAGDAVLACPPSTTYRFKKFLKRNKGPVVAVSLLLFALLAGIAGTTIGLLEAKKQERLAAERAEGERIAKLDAQANEKLAGERLVQVEAERAKAETAKADAQAKEAEANAVVAFFENKVFAAARPKGQDGGLGVGVTLRDAIAASVSKLDRRFAAQPLVEARLRMALGNTFRSLGEPELACAQDERARELFTRHRGPEHPDTLRSMNNLANSYGSLNRKADALKLREEVLAIQKRVLPPDDPETLTSMQNLANSYYSLNRNAEALKLYEETLAIMKRVLPPDHPSTLHCMNNLAATYMVANRPADALKLSEETLAIQKRVLPPDHPSTLLSMHNLANGYGALKRHAEALKLREEVLAIQKRVLPPNHPDTLLSMNNLAITYSDLKRYAEALNLHEETLAIQKRVLPQDYPEMLKSMVNVAEALIRLERGAEAIPVLDEFLAKNHTGVAGIPSQIPRAFSLRIRYFKKNGDPEGCRATAQMREALNRTDTDSLYDIACYRAVAAALQAKKPGADADRLTKEDADRAMEWLHKAVQAGWNNLSLMKSDTDLDLLRDREDFKKLLAELENKFPPKKEVIPLSKDGKK